jgi:hypothetical protein
MIRYLFYFSRFLMVLSSSQLMRNFVKLLLTIKPNKEKKIVEVLILICWYVLEFIGKFNFGSAQRKGWGGGGGVG